jgi:putative oxidoreductase
MFGTGKSSSHRYLSYADSLAVSGQDFFLLVGRVMLGLIFLMSGWGKLITLSAAAAALMRNGVPAPLAYLAPFCEFLGGLALVIGFATRYAALGLFLFVIVATYLSHRYWTYPQEQRQAQYINFWKNITIMGGMLALFVAGPGRFSLDRWLSRR